ncbi:hypothetical protein EJB05_54998, partial [Eragrostis curvula]
MPLMVQGMLSVSVRQTTCRMTGDRCSKAERVATTAKFLTSASDLNHIHMLHARLLCYDHELLHEFTRESNTMKSVPCYCVNESLKNHDFSYKIQRDKVLHAISEAIIWKQCSLMKLINNDIYIPFFLHGSVSSAAIEVF